MEDKKKFCASTVLLLIAIVVIIIMGTIIYRQNSNETDMNMEVSTIEDNEEEYSETELNDEELFYCEEVTTNDDESYTFKGVVFEPYKISTAEFKEMLKQDKVLLEENNLSNRLKDNECIIKKLDDDDFMPYELISAEDSKHFCYIKGNDEEGYQLDLGTEYSTIWKKTDNTKEYTFPKDTFYLDIESLGYANYMSKEELEEKIDTIFDYDENRFISLEGSYLKFNSSVSKITEGVISFR